ncbi:MAG: histidine kinase [Rhodospirillales bacterium]|jgi:CheY-like chemotaxis protein|nr:histidine kinase [Rhodospirillales bacterium]
MMDSEKAKAPQGGTERILVVEDDELVRGYVQSQLTRFGYQVHAVINGIEALEVLKSEEEIDLLFTDIVMPGGISGVDLAEQARNLRPGLKILFTSGYTESVVHDDARFGTKVHLLNKPYRRQDLADKLRLALRGE